MSAHHALPRRRLGRTELRVGLLGLGAMGIIDHHQPSRAHAGRLIHRALDLGVNLIDTAAAYFDSEEVLGQFLGPRRAGVVLCTKSFMRSARRLEGELLQSLRRLRSDHVDVFQLHHVQYPHELAQVLRPGGAYELLRRYRQRGAVRFIGITSHHPGVLEDALRTGLFDTVQFPYNPLEAGTFAPVLKTAGELDLGTLAMKPLSGGRLSQVEAALGYCAAAPISCVLAGCSTVEQVERDVAALSGELVVSEAEQQRLEAQLAELGELFCRRCRYCEGVCSAGLPIADIFRCHDYLVLNQFYARQEYRTLGHTPAECADCGRCEQICPYHLPVRKMLRLAHDELGRSQLLARGIALLHRAGLYDVTRRAFFRLGGARLLPKHRYLHQKERG